MNDVRESIDLYAKGKDRSIRKLMNQIDDILNDILQEVLSSEEQNNIY